MEIKTIGVIGAGQMGAGIAQVGAMAGFDVLLMDVDPTALEKGLSNMLTSLKKFVTKGKMTTSDAEEAYGRVTGVTDLDDFSEADFIIEAAPEIEKIKIDAFRRLHEICPARTILSTNTSSISVTHLASATRRPERFIGMHFIYPAPLMNLVEIIPGMDTSEETLKVTWDLTQKLGKSPELANDFPGFISNRILMPMINEAICCLHEGVGKAEAIDQVMKMGMNHPMGPLRTADVIGLDTCLAVMEVLHRGLGDDKYRPCPLLRRYVDAGRLGRKTGRGFYQYPSNTA